MREPRIQEKKMLRSPCWGKMIHNIYIYLFLAATDTSNILLQRRCSGMNLYTYYIFITITKESTGEVPREVCPCMVEISCEV